MTTHGRLTPRRDPSTPRGREAVDVLLEAAEAVLVARGRRGTTTREIARRAGVGIGSLYEYFPSRDSVLLAISVARLRGWEDQLNEHLLAGRALPAALASVLLDDLRRHPRRAVALATLEAEAPFGERVGAVRDAWAERLAGTLHASPKTCRWGLRVACASAAAAAVTGQDLDASWDGRMERLIEACFR